MRTPLRLVILRQFALLLAASTGTALAGPPNATVLLIRHAEKPPDGTGLAPAGTARAQAYVAYFRDYKVQDRPLKLAAIYSTADSKNSSRTRATVAPLATTLGLPIDARFENKDFAAMAADLEAHHAGQDVLVCWHHGHIPELLQSLGADPATVLPGGRWPEQVYDWLIVLRYGADGKLLDAQRVVEGL